MLTSTSVAGWKGSWARCPLKELLDQPQPLWDNSGPRRKRMSHRLVVGDWAASAQLLNPTASRGFPALPWKKGRQLIPRTSLSLLGREKETILLFQGKELPWRRADC